MYVSCGIQSELFSKFFSYLDVVVVNTVLIPNPLRHLPMYVCMKVCKKNVFVYRIQ